MLVATEPYGDSDFEYPEIILKPFKASSVSVIPQSEAKKVWEEEDAKAQQEALEEKERQEDLEKAIKMKIPMVKPESIKPDSIKPAEILQQTMPAIKKKEPVKTVEPKEKKVDKVEKLEPVVEQFAPVPMATTPIE